VAEVPLPADSPDLTDRRAYLHALLRLLWPEPTTIDRPGRWSRAGGGATDFLVVPNAARPALVLPRTPRHVSAAALRNYKASATGRARLKLRALAFAVRLGLAEVLPDRIRIAGRPADPEAGIDTYLSSVLKRDLSVCLYIGPSRAVEKPILQLLSSEGATFGFTKIGVNELTRSLVRRESENLEFLATKDFRALTAPKILHRSQWRGNEVLVQEALSSDTPHPVDDQLLDRAMLELATSRGRNRSALSASSYWIRLQKRISALEPTEYSLLLEDAIARIDRAAGDCALDFGSWHGDWAPWNMTQSADRILVWDWEHFEPDVPLGFDAVHCRISRTVVYAAATPRSAVTAAGREAAELLAPFGVEPSEAALVVTLYVIDIATRYLQDGEIEAGTRMGSLQNWLQGALADLLGALAPDAR
jgi:hypothetical protein